MSTSASPPRSVTPADRLASGWWRFRNSSWLLVPLFSFGILTAGAFFYIGIRAKKARWLLYGVIWAAVYVSYVLLVSVVEAGAQSNPTLRTLTAISTIVPLGLWLVGIAHAAGTNPAWLRWKAYSAQAATWDAPLYGTGQPITAPPVTPSPANTPTAPDPDATPH